MCTCGIEPKSPDLASSGLKKSLPECDRPMLLTSLERNSWILRTNNMVTSHVLCESRQFLAFRTLNICHDIYWFKDGAEWLGKLKADDTSSPHWSNHVQLLQLPRWIFLSCFFLLLQLSDARHVDLDWGMKWVKVMPPRLCCRRGWSEMGMVLDLQQCVSWI